MKKSVQSWYIQVDTSQYISHVSISQRSQRQK